MEQPQPDHILQVGLGFWASKTLLSAVEMELFTELAKHPADLETLQGLLGLHQRSSRDFFGRTGSELGVWREPVRKELQGNEAVQFGVLRFIDDAHPPATQLLIKSFPL